MSSTAAAGSRRRRRAKGEGSVFREGQYWVGQVYAGRYPNGRPRPVRVKRKRQADVLAEMETLKRRASAGDTGHPTASKSVAWYLSWFVENVKASEVAPVTLTNYRNRAKRASEHIGSHKLGKLTTAHVQYLANQLRERGQGVRPVLILVNAALRWAVQADIVAKNVAEGVNPGTYVATTDDRLRSDEADRVLKLASADDDAYALFYLALNYGLRISELVNLAWDDVDLEGRSMTVRKSKTEAGKRTVPLTDDALSVLRAHPRTGAYVFTRDDGRPLSRQGLRDQLNGYLEAAGVAHRCAACGTGRVCSTSVRRFHALRHTAATLLLEQGVAIEVVSAILGHSKLGVTHDIYGRPRQDLVRAKLTEAATRNPRR